MNKFWNWEKTILNTFWKRNNFWIKTKFNSEQKNESKWKLNQNKKEFKKPTPENIEEKTEKMQNRTRREQETQKTVQKCTSKLGEARVPKHGNEVLSLPQWAEFRNCRASPLSNHSFLNPRHQEWDPCSSRLPNSLPLPYVDRPLHTSISDQPFSKPSAASSLLFVRLELLPPCRSRGNRWGQQCWGANYAPLVRLGQLWHRQASPNISLPSRTPGCHRSCLRHCLGGNLTSQHPSYQSWHRQASHSIPFRHSRSRRPVFPSPPALLVAIGVADTSQTYL
jgi:hypothetical protein